jgi:anaerobic selenocysteine-containing dehydrogenase
MRRAGSKGEPLNISWDGRSAFQFSAIADFARGSATIVLFVRGDDGLLQYGSMYRRFFHRLGASLLDRTICATAGKAGWVATVGAAMGTDVQQFANSGLILIWGSNPVVSNLHFWRQAQEAKRRGARLVAIDPYRSQTRKHAHVALRTDAALALGMMQWIAEDLVDHDYISATIGFDARRPCPPNSPSAWASGRAAKVVDLARAYGTTARASASATDAAPCGVAAPCARRAGAHRSWRDPAWRCCLIGHRPSLRGAGVDIRGKPRTIIWHDRRCASMR